MLTLCEENGYVRDAWTSRGEGELRERTITYYRVYGITALIMIMLHYHLLFLDIYEKYDQFGN